MKKIFTLFFTTAFVMGTMSAQNTRYIDEVFTNVTTLTNQVFGANVTVITSPPSLDTLKFDLYMPTGDTCNLRPLAVVLHTGTFLPRGVIAPTGDKDDYANVQICERLAKRGYVAASIQYRIGWNPQAPHDTTRRSQIINAAYRGVQDLYTFLRYANLTVGDLGNPFKIDTGRVAVFGIGTGAFVGFNAAVLTQDEIYIDKFTNPAGTPMIDTFLVGDLHGVKQGLINIPNHVGYNDDFHFAFGLDGAIGDSTWLEDGNSVPLVAGGNVTHPTTPFGINILGEIDCDMPVFAFGQYVVDISGSVCMIEKANSLGINAPLSKGIYDDPVSVALRENENTFGQEHLWAINQPGPQTGPWEFWNRAFWSTIPSPIPGVSIDSLAILTNPEMSQEKADRYIDTALWFFSPRAYVALKLNELLCGACDSTFIQDPLVFLINDFECHQNYSFGAGADRVTVMDNPLLSAENGSEKAGAYLEPANDAFAALCVNFDNLDLSVFNLFQVDVNSPFADIPFLIKLEGGGSPASEVWVNTTTSGTWETLTADFSSQRCADHTRICIFPNGGVDSPNEVNYFLDNLRLVQSGSFCETGLFYPSVKTLEISPNPVDNILYIRNPGEATDFRMTNTLGQQVRNEKSEGHEMTSITVSDLSPGIYLIGAYDAKGNLIANARILKN